jgi:hypothetical protein
MRRTGCRCFRKKCWAISAYTSVEIKGRRKEIGLHTMNFTFCVTDQILLKGKGKVHPRTGHEGPEGE